MFFFLVVIFFPPTLLSPPSFSFSPEPDDFSGGAANLIVWSWDHLRQQDLGICLRHKHRSTEPATLEAGAQPSVF